MNNQFLYYPQQAMVRQPTFADHQLLIQRQVSPNSKVNHQSPPAARIMYPPSPKCQAENIMGGNPQKVPLHMMRDPNSFNSHPSHILDPSRQLIENPPREFDHNRLYRSNTDAFTFNSTQPEAFKEAARSKGFSDFNPRDNEFQRTYFQPPQSPKSIQQIVPVRRVSQYKSNASQASDQKSNGPPQNMHFPPKPKGQSTPSLTISSQEPLVIRKVSVTNQSPRAAMQQNVGYHLIQQIPFVRQTIVSQTHSQQPLNYNQKHFIRSPQIYQQEDQKGPSPPGTEKIEQYSSAAWTNKMVGVGLYAQQQKLMLNTRKLIDEIFENETHKALLQIRLLESKSRQKLLQRRSNSRSGRD